MTGGSSWVALGSALDHYMKLLGAPPVTVLAQLNESWVDVVGPGLAEHTRPLEVVHQRLVIGCRDQIWANQVTWMSDQIITSFNSLFAPESLQSVAVRVSAFGD